MESMSVCQLSELQNRAATDELQQLDDMLFSYLNNVPNKF
jgi:hypothetical protein